MEYNKEFTTKAQGNTNTVLGAIGTAGALMNGLGGIFGGMGGNVMAVPAGGACCSENQAINRYELAQEQKIAELQSQIALRDANIYQDQKALELYKYVDGKFAAVEQQLCQQAVVNAQTTANISCMQQSIAALQGLTKTVVPIDNICPQPMPQYNSWTAPTTEAGA